MVPPLITERRLSTLPQPAYVRPPDHFRGGPVARSVLVSARPADRCGPCYLTTLIVAGYIPATPADAAHVGRKLPFLSNSSP